MINIPVNTFVESTDGPCGESISIIVDPVNKTVTHVVVKSKWMPHTEYMVPTDKIAEATPNLIKLACSESEFKMMEQYISHRFEKTHILPHYGQDTMMAWPYTTPEGTDLPVEYERVPAGELAVHKGTYVQATDGLAGKVDELLIDPKSGQITHLVLREGHLWGKKVLTLPISEIDYTDKDNVYLKLDKKAIEALPAVPLKQRADISNIELMMFVLADTDKANDVLKALKKLCKEESIHHLNVAVLEKDKEGNTSIKETEDVGPRQGTIFGAITGGLIGLMGGPAGVVVGAAAGAATGRAAAKRIDMGFSNEYLKKLQEELRPGTSAVVTLVGDEWQDKISGTLTSFDGQLIRHPLTDEVMGQLAKEI